MSYNASSDLIPQTVRSSLQKAHSSEHTRTIPSSSSFALSLALFLQIHWVPISTRSENSLSWRHRSKPRLFFASAPNFRRLSDRSDEKTRVEDTASFEDDTAAIAIAKNRHSNTECIIIVVEVILGGFDAAMLMDEEGTS